jgi:hypothetical protein
VVGGAGLIRAFTADSVDALPLSHSETALDLGGGATGFVSDRIGLNWDVRYFRTFQKGFAIDGVSYGPNLSFWRVSMGLTIRP